jgi:GT2 family glycosyltransferase
MSFSVVILSRNPVNLRACVEAILRCEPELSPERIVIVDDDETGDIATQFTDGPTSSLVTLIRGEKPFCFARNANIGLRHAFLRQRSEVVILLNDDAQLETPGGFTRLAELAVQNKERYGVLSAATNSVGNLNQTRKHTPLTIRPEPKTLCFVCVSITRACWYKVGPLDEDFAPGYGWEDTAYSMAVKAAGLKLGIVDGCFVDHLKLKSTFRTMPTNGQDFLTNRAIFIEKWGTAAAK